MATPVKNGFSAIFLSTPSVLPQLLPWEEQYVQQLARIPLDSILDNRSGAEKCKKLVQEIFDKAMATHNGDTSKTKDVFIRICDAIYSICNDASFRKEYIECAWNEIGDAT